MKTFTLFCIGLSGYGLLASAVEGSLLWGLLNAACLYINVRSYRQLAR